MDTPDEEMQKIAEKIASELRLAFVAEYLARENLGEPSEKIFKDLLKDVENGEFQSRILNS